MFSTYEVDLNTIKLNHQAKCLGQRQRPTERGFCPHGASCARVIAMIACLSVCVYACVSHAGIVSKRLNVGSRKQHDAIAQGI